MRIKQYPKINETVYSAELENGLAINIIAKPGYSKCFAMFATNYGGADRRFRLHDDWIDTPAGVAHFLEHKMFDTPDGGNALTVLSARGASPNAFTSSGMTAYHFECTSDFEENLRTLLSFVSVPYFTEESIQKEQGIIGQEIRMVEDMPGHAIYYNLLKCLYQQNPVRESVAGSIESIAEITAQTLYDCHKVFYSPSNMVLNIAGDVDPEHVVSIAREILSSERQVAPERDYGTEESELPLQQYISVNMEVSAPQFLLGARIQPAKHGLPLLHQQLVAELALECMFGTSSPLYVKLYADGLLSHDFGAEFDYSAGSMVLLAGGESRDPDTVAIAMRDELTRFASEGPTAEFFIRTKKVCFGDHLRTLGYFRSLCSEMCSSHFLGFSPLDAFELLETITSEDVRSFVAAHLTPEKLAMSVILPK
ncbi:MAG: EF-P 5-aminopentanol modification-associated protein YfmH [Oscillospiraceae bacterium]|jgi:predicted Zn-dependent peptidase